LFEPTRIPPGLLDPVAQVVDKLIGAVPSIETSEIMLVGAFCRDAMHAALGHEFATPPHVTSTWLWP
jgi:predicted nucleotidyltransferase